MNNINNIGGVGNNAGQVPIYEYEFERTQNPSKFQKIIDFLKFAPLDSPEDFSRKEVLACHIYCFITIPVYFLPCDIACDIETKLDKLESKNVFEMDLMPKSWEDLTDFKSAAKKAKVIFRALVMDEAYDDDDEEERKSPIVYAVSFKEIPTAPDLGGLSVKELKKLQKDYEQFHIAIENTIKEVEDGKIKLENGMTEMEGMKMEEIELEEMGLKNKKKKKVYGPHLPPSPKLPPLSAGITLEHLQAIEAVYVTINVDIAQKIGERENTKKKSRATRFFKG
jgi:hypothetical protein